MATVHVPISHCSIVQDHLLCSQTLQAGTQMWHIGDCFSAPHVLGHWRAKVVSSWPSAICRHLVP